MKFPVRVTWLLGLLLCLVVTSLYGQQTLSGVILDDLGDPLIGANLMIKGTDRGTVTDIDGKYSIKCSPGETLVISYTGYATTETLLTARSFQKRNNKTSIKQKEVKKITSSAYLDAIRAYRDTAKIVTSPRKKYKLKNRIYRYHKIKDIAFEEDEVLFKLSDDLWKYQIGFSQNIGISFLTKNRLPEIQTRFAGGTNVSGDQSLLDSNDEIPQAFGPAFSDLSYDGIPTSVNPSGQLIFDSNGNEVQTSGPDIFPTVLLSTTGLNLKMTKDKNDVYLRLSNQIGKDIFGVRPYSNNRVSLSWNKRMDKAKLSIKGGFEKNRNDQSNRNGLANNIYQFAYQSPTEFPLNFESNRNRNQTTTNGPFDNPFYLLEEALDQHISTRWNLGGVWSHQLFYNELDYSFKTNISGSQQKNNFFPGQNQVGNLSSLKQNYESPNWQNQLDLRYDFNSLFDNMINQVIAKLIARHNFEKLDYSYASENTIEALLQLKRNNLDIITQLEFEGNYDDLIDRIHVYNQIFFSSYDQQKYFLPGISVKLSAEKWLKEVKFMNQLFLAGEFNRSIYQQPLLYQNYAWNYSVLDVFDQANYVVYPALATPENLKLETRTNFVGSLNAFGFDNRLSLRARYYYTRRNEVVGHLGTLGNTQIENLATLREQGLEIEFAFTKNRYYRRQKNFSAQFIFELNRSKVIGLKDENQELILGGNAAVQQILEKGASSGALRGTTWLRNANGDLMIGESGYPMVDFNPSIIGDALPDFRLKLNLLFENKRFSTGLNLTYSKGGDAWNGTLASLDFLGLSQNSADLRETTDFIFPGVNLDGTINSTPVNFAESNGSGNLNYWQRYGSGGVGEAYIEDASFLTLSNVFFGYRILKNGDLINSISLKIYGNNLIAWLPFSGFSPYRTFRDLDTTTGIQLFNLPMNSEVGIQLKMEI